MKANHMTTTRQQVLWVPSSRTVTGLDLRDALRPTRVWTLIGYTEEDETPPMPFENPEREAYPEPYLTAWAMADEGSLHYYSQYTYSGIWILVEYDE